MQNDTFNLFLRANKLLYLGEGGVREDEGGCKEKFKDKRNLVKKKEKSYSHKIVTQKLTHLK
jgi:hypothetical protein